MASLIGYARVSSTDQSTTIQVARLKEASVEEITAVPGIGVATARAVLEALGGQLSEQGSEPQPQQDGGPRVLGPDAEVGAEVNSDAPAIG